MLYVFMVNTGSMLTLDMALTMESVQRLQETLALEYQLPVDKQVLLISGGQSLDPHIRVCSYSAGTDTNPIFLFSKGTIEAAIPPITSITQQSSEEKLRLQVEGLKNLPHSYSAVVARTQLALQFHDLAKENLRLCEGLVHDQHLQQQGWMAVVANLEDITSAFEQRAVAFKQSMKEFLEDRPQLLLQLTEFEEILILLEKTPLLPCLVEESCIINKEILQDGSTVSLMQWISSQDQRSTLEQMAQQCTKSLDQFNQQVLDAMSTEINKTLGDVNNGSMKEVKGLGERLFGLEQLLTNAQKVLQEQAEMAQGMVQNQTRASNLNDTSVLPDLCKSHQQQLTVMYKKHCQLVEISRRCQAAKEELCHNLHVRLRWIMYVEQQISAVHSKMLVYHENLKRLRKRLEIVRQVYAAPKLYASAIVEVYRRRLYSSHFTAWAGQVCDTSLASHQSEMVKRRNFASSMERHFLNVLFPGLVGEVPPTFATTQPEDFDTQLPEIKDADITSMREKLPELAHILKLPAEQTDLGSECALSKALLPALSDEQTQTSLNIQEIEELRSIETEGTQSDDAKISTTDRTTPDGNMLRPNSLPAGVELSSIDSSSNRITVPETFQSLSFRHVDSFVSAATTPDLELSPLDMSTQGETPFASLLTAPEGNFYSAVTSPLDDMDSLSKHPIKDNSVSEFVEKVTILQETIQEREASLEESQHKIKEIQDQLEKAELKLASIKDERSLYADQLRISQTGMKSIIPKIETSVHKLKSDLTEMRTAVKFEQRAFHETILTSVSSVESFCGKVQSLLKEREEAAVSEAVELLQVQSDAKCNDLIQDLERTQEEVELCRRELHDAREQLTEKEAELSTLKERSCQELQELQSQLEEQQKEKLIVVKSKSEKDIQELQNTVKENEDAIRMMRETAEEEVTMLQNHLAAEKEQALNALRTELKEKHNQELDVKQRHLQDTQLDELAEFRKTTELKMDAACEELTQSLNKAKEDELHDLKMRLESNHRDKVQLLCRELQNKLLQVKEIHDETSEDVKQELRSVRILHEQLIESSHLRMTEMEESFTTCTRSVSETSEGKLESDEQLGDVAQMSSSVMKTLDREQVGMVAERQQAFNEAVSRVAVQKDKTIEELRRKVAKLSEHQNRNQDTIEKLLTDKGDIESELTKALHQARQSEKELKVDVFKKEAQLTELQQRLDAASVAGPAQLLVSSECDTMVTKSATEGRLQALLRSKEQECSALKHQVMQLRVSSNSSTRTEKISIIDISVGDLVLIFFEEPRDNYVVFSIEPTLYFVHSESLSGLDLKHQASDGPKRQWIIGRVTDKEYCQAKKANNRFKVAIGTKFYRVKAKRYDIKQDPSTTN
ncbi:RB1-inducible coiled-coil protein 1-like [Asterias amurensis]|uniref:RB1-inducible coiled-coil protein 1-like n=1 Tax=Asterias amurensis TaxID=7602 RepID=UPI003AB79CE9